MDFVKANFFSKKENQKTQGQIYTPGQALPSDSLLALTKHLHHESVVTGKGNLTSKFKYNASTPSAIWISMASLHEHFKKKPKTQKDSALADVGKVLSEDFKFKLLNKEEIEIDAQFVNKLTDCIDRYLKNSKKPNTGYYRPAINIVLSAHGAPSWFFGPLNTYHYPKHGCIWPNFKFDGESSESKALLDKLQYSYFILTDTHVYYFNKTQNRVYQKTLPSQQNNDFWRHFNKNNLKNSQDSQPTIASLNRDELVNLLPLFAKKNWERFDSYHLKSFIQDECDYAKWMADAFKEVESKTQVEFTSVILFSCNSASEFINEKTFEASLSSARILSTLFRNRYVIGGIGLNSNGKANGVYHYPEIGGDVPSPNLEKTLTVYRNERVVYRPSEPLYLKQDFFHNLEYMQYLNSENEFVQSSYVLEQMEQHYHLINFLEHGSEFAGFQISVLNKMLVGSAFKCDIPACQPAIDV